MTAFFPTHFRNALFSNGNLLENANIRLVLFRSAPSLDTIDPTWLAARTKAELIATFGWVEVSGIAGYPLTNTLNVATRAVAIPGSSPARNNRYLIIGQYPFSQLSEATPAEAIGVEFVGTVNGVVNPLIMVSNTPVGTGVSIFPKDSLTANPDTTLGSQSNRWLMAWAEPGTGETVVNPVEGPLSIFKGAPDFEASNTVHVWLYPSRANMIANPSFEAVGTGYWASNGAITRVPNPAPGGGAFSGQFTAGAAPVIIESNVWSTKMGQFGSEYWTIQLMVAGVGRVKVGLVSWDADYRATECDWGDETWELQANLWYHIVCVRRAPDADTAMVRIEGADYATMFIDRVLAERGALKERDYFDGDSTFSLQDSYSWYGGYARRGATYSMWYDMRRAVMGRLFATPVSDTYPGNVLSDAEVAEAGMVYQWVPAGVTVVPHIDVFYPGDTRPPPPAKAAAIQPYYHPVTQRMGVINPWV